MIQDTRELFARHDLRCTKQRQHVYEVLAACRSHPTAEELHRMVAVDAPGTSLATVYNTLEALCRAGLCRKIAAPTGAARYDADVRDHMHVVTSDGRIIDVPHELGAAIMANLPQNVLSELEARMGLRVNHIDLQFFADPVDRGSTRTA